jgi:hypothetical protein
MINGVNYWEEHGKTGKSAGLTTWKDAKLTLNDDHSAHIEMDLVYNPPGKPIVLVEHRVIDVSAPDANGGYQFDWTATFTAKADKVLLDRTPITGEPGARNWGGYAGLSVRFAQNTKHFEITDSDGKVEKQADSLRFKARAVDFAGTIDKTTGGIAILDHPQNLNAPTPWYVSRGMPYFSPAVIYDAPHKISAGESFVLRYRVLVHPGRLTPEALRENQQKFIEVQN